jgi:sugar lactone lactonase YvrE
MNGNRVVRIGRDGRTSTVTARIRNPNAIAIAPNGTLYVSSVSVGAVYRVARNTGIATRVSR